MLFRSIAVKAELECDILRKRFVELGVFRAQVGMDGDELYSTGLLNVFLLKMPTNVFKPVSGAMYPYFTKSRYNTAISSSLCVYQNLSVLDK